MSLVIDDPELERRLRALAAERGESVEEVVLIEPHAHEQSVPGYASRSSTQSPDWSARHAWQKRERIVDRINAETRD